MTNETHRELLELAAKAAGLEIDHWIKDGNGVPVAVLRGPNQIRWQPLLENQFTDCMGDALRLAMKLGFSVECGRCWVTQRGPMFGEDVLQGENYATCRAIVRAAARPRWGIE